MPACILNLALDRGEWSASSLGCFTIMEKKTGTHWIGDWVGARANLGTVEKVACFCLESNPDSSAIKAVAQAYRKRKMQTGLVFSIMEVGHVMWTTRHMKCNVMTDYKYV
jgi:hypothetical protein